jgi:protease I
VEEKTGLKGKKVLILVEDLYQDLELWYPRLRLTEEGAQVTMAGPRKGEYRGKNGYPVFAEISFDKVKPDHYDALVIPGGYAPDRLRRYEKVIEIVRKMNAQGKIIAFICHAGWVLASADILKGKKATCFHAIKDDLVNAGAEYIDAAVVVDGNLISSRMPQDLPEFCKAIIAKLK